MTNGSSFADAVSRLTAQADAVGQLAQNSGAFAAVVAAFESRDPNAFRWVLGTLELLPQCELICDWVRTKICVLRCLEVCGPPREKIQTPNPKEFAGAIVRLASNEKLLRRVVDAVSCGNAEDYRAAIDELDLNAFCYWLCHWICWIIYNRVCEVVCTPEPVRLPDAVNEIRAAAKVIASVVANEKLFDAIGKAAVSLDCETLQSDITNAGFGSECEFICHLICSWRCAWVCLELCELPSPVFNSGVDGIEEARNFALAARQFASHPRALGDLVIAVQDRDAKAYGVIISRFGLGPYCQQVCAWVCSVLCYEFCTCVCPPPALQPWFTTVGNFDIYTQIDPTSGLTNTSLTPTIDMPYGGGPKFAFFEQLQLGGYCPVYSPTHSGVPMQYRFLYATATTALAGAISASQTSITVAGGAITPATPFNMSVCICSPNGETGETMTVTNVLGTTWTVLRGQEGTTAAAAGAGATLFINPAPITGPLVDSPLLVGQRIITWPENSAGLASATLVPTFEPVYVGYGTDTPQPAPGAPYVGPTHYIPPDPTTGWVAVDPTIIAGCFQYLLNFDTTQLAVAPARYPFGSESLAIGNPGGAPAGSPVLAPNLGAGTDLAIIFQATRVTPGTTVDYSNSLCKIHINNWWEVNNLWFVEFTGATGCCTPIDATLSVQFTVDHEEMNSGAWSLAIDSCSPSAPGDITPTNPTPGVTFTAGGRGANGAIVEDTSAWSNCSYQGWLYTRPGLTTGLADREVISNLLTFCICGHYVTTLVKAINATQTSVTVASSAGFPSTPFNVTVGGTGETMTVTNVLGTTWTVVRGQDGTTAAAAAAGATLSTL
jgi:hypothetical protein